MPPHLCKPRLSCLFVLILASRVTSAIAVGSGPATPGFSDLAAINVQSIARLAPVFTFRMSVQGDYSGTVKAAGGLVFVQSPFPHTVYALDPARPDNPIRWSVTPAADRGASGQATTRTVAGPVLEDGMLYLNTFDGHTMAIDAASGRVDWDVQTAHPSQGETLSTAPLPAEGKLFVGGGGDDFGARGWIEALDPATGRTLWKRYNTGPDSDVGAGSGDLGVSTWPPQSWQQGGGSALGLAYDPALHLLLHSTGHPAPWNPDQRQGDNRWTSGLFARDPASGAARWFLPVNPHDLYALGAGPSNLVIDLDWQGKPRHLLVHPDGNGRVYVVDRGSGELLSAEAFVPTNATKSVDLATRILQRENTKSVNVNIVARDICPGWPGATGPGAAAYDPATRLLYIPVSRICMDMEARDTTYMAGTPYMGANLRMKAAGPSRGALVAWNIAAAKPAWTVEERFPLVGGVLATAGGVVFYGTLDGLVKAVDARTGQQLWQYQAPFGIIVHARNASRPATGGNTSPCCRVAAASAGSPGKGPTCATSPRPTATPTHCATCRSRPSPAARCCSSPSRDAPDAAGSARVDRLQTRDPRAAHGPAGSRRHSNDVRRCRSASSGAPSRRDCCAGGALRKQRLPAQSGQAAVRLVQLQGLPRQWRRRCPAPR